MFPAQRRCLNVCSCALLTLFPGKIPSIPPPSLSHFVHLEAPPSLALLSSQPHRRPVWLITHHSEHCFQGQWLRGSRQPPPLRNQLLEQQPLGRALAVECWFPWQPALPEPLPVHRQPKPSLYWKLLPQTQSCCLDNFNDTYTKTLGIFNQRNELFLAAVFCSLSLSGLAPSCKVWSYFLNGRFISPRSTEAPTGQESHLLISLPFMGPGRAQHTGGSGSLH